MKNQVSQFDKNMIEKSVELAIANVEKGGEPFGAVLTKGLEVIAEGTNETYVDQDSTAHAEIQALRNTGIALGTAHYPDTTMYASGKPCAMCMAAMIQAGVSRVIFAADDDLGKLYGWSTEHLYKRMQEDFGNQGVEIINIPHLGNEEAFERYRKKHGLGGNDSMEQ